MITPDDKFYQELSKQPSWYFWDFHEDEAIFVNMDAASYRESIFTDQRIITSSSRRINVPEADLYQAIPQTEEQPSTINYIFHVAHCGSTLLAKSFDFLETTLVYREPRVLRKLGCSKHSTDDSALFQSRLDCACYLLGRSFDPTHNPIVKANVPVNFLLPDLISNPVHHMRGILLYQTLDIYLLNLYKNNQQRHQWINQVVKELAIPISQQTELTTSEILNFSVEKKMVALWIAQIRCYQEAMSFSNQLLPLNAEDYFTDPITTLIKVSRHFEVPLNHKQVQQIVNSKLYKSYSKSKEHLPYTNELRLKLQQKLQEKHHGDIDTILKWADKKFGNLQQYGFY